MCELGTNYDNILKDQSKRTILSTLSRAFSFTVLFDVLPFV